MVAVAAARVRWQPFQDSDDKDWPHWPFFSEFDTEEPSPSLSPEAPEQSKALLGSGDMYAPWIPARATFYGGPHDTDARVGGPTIHECYCGFGTLDLNKGTGWNTVAFADANNMPGNHGCGTCYELRCRPAVFTDGHGQALDRQGACTQGNTPVTVKVTDLCPCKYATNQASNSRWCCGDAVHMDLSEWAFQKIADVSLGAIGVEYRQVACPV